MAEEPVALMEETLPSQGKHLTGRLEEQIEKEVCDEQQTGVDG